MNHVKKKNHISGSGPCLYKLVIDFLIRTFVRGFEGGQPRFITVKMVNTGRMSSLPSIITTTSKLLSANKTDQKTLLPRQNIQNSSLVIGFYPLNHSSLMICANIWSSTVKAALYSTIPCCQQVLFHPLPTSPCGYYILFLCTGLWPQTSLAWERWYL